MLKQLSTESWDDRLVNDLISLPLNTLFDNIDNNACEMNFVEQIGTRRALNVFIAKGAEAVAELDEVANEVPVSLTQTLNESKQIPLFKDIDIEGIKKENIFEVCQVMSNNMQSHCYMKLTDTKNDYAVIVTVDQQAVQLRDVYRERLAEIKNYENNIKPISPTRQ